MRGGRYRHGVLSYGRQVHGAAVRRAGGAGEPGDGLWTDTPGQPLLVFTADCLPVAIVRSNGGPAAAAALHVGWRGLLAGIVANAVAALDGGTLAAAIGPGIGPCCYQVGDEVAGPFARGTARKASATDGSTSGPPPSVRWRRPASQTCTGPTSARPAIRTCFFSHRRDAGRTGRQGMIAYVS